MITLWLTSLLKFHLCLTALNLSSIMMGNPLIKKMLLGFVTMRMLIRIRKAKTQIKPVIKTSGLSQYSKLLIVSMFFHKSGGSILMKEMQGGKKNLRELPYPWQIAPLWTEDVSHLSNIAQSILQQPGRTTFVCRLYDSAVPEVQNQLIRFTNCAENILFLSRTRRVTISVNGQRYSIENRNEVLLINEVVANLWKRFSIPVPIPDTIKAYLIGLKPSECPLRLKDPAFSQATISFCHLSKDNEFIQNQGIRFFCSLPVGVMGDWPILVNAPFLLNASREAIVDNQWNDFLIQQKQRMLLLLAPREDSLAQHRAGLLVRHQPLNPAAWSNAGSFVIDSKPDPSGWDGNRLVHECKAVRFLS